MGQKFSYQLLLKENFDGISFNLKGFIAEGAFYLNKNKITKTIPKN
jgi:hypothetical protein